MRKLRVLGLLVSSMLIAQICLAQSALVNIPRQSQHAVLTQRIGITDVTINYHRPLANGRPSFFEERVGDLR